MFKIDTMNAKGDIKVIVSYGGESLEFTISEVISKKNKLAIENDRMYGIVNAYVNYKGDVFKSELYNTLATSLENTRKTVFNTYMYPLPYNILHPILDMFDILDIFNFLKNIFKLRPPQALPDVFDTRYETDNRGSRVQTYLKDDYLELAALAVIVKVGLLPVAEFGLIKAKEIKDKHLEYVLFEFFKTHRIYETAPMVKLLGLVGKLVSSPTNSKESHDINVIENQIPKSEMPIYLLSIIILQKVAAAGLIEDNDDSNIVTKIYVYVNTKLKDKQDMSKTIRDKTLSSNGEDGDKESFFEGNRTPADISTGDAVEMEWAIGTIDDVITQLPLAIRDVLNHDAIQDAEEFTKVFTNGNIHDTQIKLLAVLFKGVIDPRCLEHVSRFCIINLLTVGFGYLWGAGFKHLALILVSQRDIAANDAMSINSSIGRTRLSKEIKEELDRIAPNRRPTNDTVSVNLVEEWINATAAKLTECIWLQVAPDEYVVEALGNKNYRNLLSSDIRLQLAEMIIKNEELCYGGK